MTQAAINYKQLAIQEAHARLLNEVKFQDHGTERDPKDSSSGITRFTFWWDHDVQVEVEARVDILHDYPATHDEPGYLEFDDCGVITNVEVHGDRHNLLMCPPERHFRTLMEDLFPNHDIDQFEVDFV